MRFEYYYIRPCVSTKTETLSFTGEPQWVEEVGEVYTKEAALTEAQEFLANAEDAIGGVFWTVYGVDEEGLSHAIGDFTTFDRAYEIMSAILMPMREACTLLEQATTGQRPVEVAHVILDETCNQSTCEWRL